MSSIKNRVASLIDLVDAYKDLDPRLCSITITKLEEAAMFAVKLITTSK